VNLTYRAVFSVLEIFALNSLTSLAVAPFTLSSPMTSPANPPVIAAEGDSLTSEQRARLYRLKIPLVLPTYLPPGFQVKRFETGTEETIDYKYSYYSLVYAGADNTCLELAANTDPAMTTGGLNNTSIATPLGQVTVSSGNVEGKPLIIGLFSLPRNNGYFLRTGGWVSGKRCAPVSREEYLRALRSLKRVENSR
jgi:hypothetical protein